MSYQILSVLKQMDLSHGCSQCGSTNGAFFAHVFFPEDNCGKGMEYFKWFCGPCITKGGE